MLIRKLPLPGLDYTAIATYIIFMHYDGRMDEVEVKQNLAYGPCSQDHSQARASVSLKSTTTCIAS